MIKLSNIADLIEEYILRKLAAEDSKKIELRRTDIAGEIECAPSQISYVLNTRFTLERGFTVESRRGLGGFIRITRVPIQKMIYRDILQEIDEDIPFEKVKSIVHYLLKNRLISNREAALVMQFTTLAFQQPNLEERKKALQAIFLTLADFS